MSKEHDPSMEELFSGDDFDDSIRLEHQQTLRAEALEIFDRSQQDASVTRARQESPPLRHLQIFPVVGYATILAALLLGFLTWWISQSSRLPTRPDVPQVTTIAVDAQLLESLAVVDSYRNDVSPEAYFEAMAACRYDFQGRKQFESK